MHISLTILTWSLLFSLLSIIGLLPVSFCLPSIAHGLSPASLSLSLFSFGVPLVSFGLPPPCLPWSPLVSYLSLLVSLLLFLHHLCDSSAESRILFLQHMYPQTVSLNLILHVQRYVTSAYRLRIAKKRNQGFLLYLLYLSIHFILKKIYQGPFL